MAIEWNRFWCRVLFKEYIKHYRKMTDEQIVRDVRQSMDDLEDLVADTDSFGSQMVRWSNERSEEPFATAARENGKKGGRPKKETTADAPTREDGEFKSDSSYAANLESATSANNSEARQSQRAGANAPKGGRTSQSHSAPARSSGAMPKDVQLVYDFAAAENLDINDAYECWCCTINDRNGKDADGKPVNNWKAYVRQWCKTRAANRRAG